MRTSAIFLFILMTFNTLASSNKAIYDSDDRIDFNDIYDQQHREWALATAAMIPNYIIREDDNGMSKIKGKMLQQVGICEYERFSRQLTAADCTGFLVSETKLVTAGHCVRKKSDCSGWNWVFDYRQSEKYKIGRTIYVPQSSVYRCKKIIMTSNRDELDLAVIELDRPVLDRPYLKVRKDGHVTKKMNLTLVGYPSGIPVKVAPNAKVKSPNLSRTYFMATTDSFEGNSGSPVINSDTGLVEGVLVRGEEDYHFERRNGKRCLVPTVCTSQDHCSGEAVTKISHALGFLD